MRITVRHGRVVVTAPWFVRASTIETAVEAKRDWVARKTQAQRRASPPALPEAFIDGATMLYRGRRLAIRVTRVESQAPAIRFANRFHVTIPAHLGRQEGERTARRLVIDWCKRRALADVNHWIGTYARRTGLHPSRLRIGDQKTLWGSCSARGTISLNWRLIAAPRRVFEYVVVHELCHLAEHNHGPAFWTMVEELLPDFREHRAWLKRHGVALS